MTPELTIVTRLQGNNAELKRGNVTPDGFALKFVEVPVLVHAFRAMVRNLEYDVCEMALTTYLCAREHGVPFTALPIFLVRGFHHGAILRQAGSGIEEPKQLEGRRVGVNRGYTVTTGVWARAILREEYGVDLSRVTWVLSGDEHVESYQPPPNVVPIERGASIESLLESGDLAAAINIQSTNAETLPLINNPVEAGFAAFRNSGHYPINHLVVVRDDVLEAHPGVARSLFDAFTESKEQYLLKLRQDAVEKPDKIDHMHARLMALGAEPLPYGVEPNRKMLEKLMDHALDQQILRRRVPTESVFAPSTIGLVG